MAVATLDTSQALPVGGVPDVAGIMATPGEPSQGASVHVLAVWWAGSFCWGRVAGKEGRLVPLGSPPPHVQGSNLPLCPASGVGPDLPGRNQAAVPPSA